MLIDIDYEGKDIPASAKEFRPAVYKDGDSFCVLLGEDPQAGIFGCGETTKAALEDWENHFNDRLQSHLQGDELVQYIEDTRKTSKKDMQ